MTLQLVHDDPWDTQQTRIERERDREREREIIYVYVPVDPEAFRFGGQLIRPTFRGLAVSYRKRIMSGSSLFADANVSWLLSCLRHSNAQKKRVYHIYTYSICFRYATFTRSCDHTLHVPAYETLNFLSVCTPQTCPARRAEQSASYEFPLRKLAAKL